MVYDNLIHIISGFIKIQDSDKKLIKKLFKPLQVTKDAILIKSGECSDSVFYVNTGYLRYFKVLSGGVEQTIHLSSPGEFATAFCSFVSGVKSEETLYAVTDADLFYIQKSNLEKLYSSDDRWQIFGRKLMEYLLLLKEKRLIEHLSLNAQARYIRLLDKNPDLIQNVPIQYIASYIGLQPETLNRLRRQIFSINTRRNLAELI